MSNFKVGGKTLLEIGYPKSPVFRLAMKVMDEHFNHLTRDEAIDLLKNVLADPDAYVNDALLGPVAEQLLTPVAPKEIELRETPVPYAVFGADNIAEGALKQLNAAVRLPVAVAGSLMPDAHQGYGLPIGGVLAADNAVIPYGVGVDIGCRMCLSILDLPEQSLLTNEDAYKKQLVNWTKFGAGVEWKQREPDPVLERSEFKEIRFVKNLLDKAAGQLGTSGSGNHFVEWGIATISDVNNEWGLVPGNYVALLSHSGHDPC